MIRAPLKKASLSASRIFFGSFTSFMNCSLNRRYSASYSELAFFFFCDDFCFGVGRPFLEESRSRRCLSASTTRLICLAQETTVWSSPVR